MSEDTACASAGPMANEALTSTVPSGTSTSARRSKMKSTEMTTSDQKTTLSSALMALVLVLRWPASDARSAASSPCSVSHAAMNSERAMWPSPLVSNSCTEKSLATCAPAASTHARMWR